MAMCEREDIRGHARPSGRFSMVVVPAVILPLREFQRLIRHVAQTVSV